MITVFSSLKTLLISVLVNVIASMLSCWWRLLLCADR